MQNSQTEIEKRKSLWIVLSEFYVDTELNNDDLERIANLFIDSGFSIEEIKNIDLYEVFPLLQNNLLSPAGTWAGFDEVWLSDSCERLYRKRNNWFYRRRIRFKNRLFYWMRKRYWEQLEKRINDILRSKNKQ